jgi:hypothetical protein
MFLEDCMRTEPAIFAIYVQCSKQSFDSPCNLRTSHAVHRAIFAPRAAGRGAIVRDGSSSALILMVPAVWLGRTQMPLHDPGRASLTVSHGAIRLGRSLALPESRKAV